MEEMMYRMSQSEHDTDYTGSSLPSATNVMTGSVGYSRQLSRSPPPTTPDSARKKRSLHITSPRGNGCDAPSSPRISEGASSPRAFFSAPLPRSPRSPRDKSFNIQAEPKKQASPKKPAKLMSPTSPADTSQSVPVSPSAHTPSSGLKRSGTYDLLDQDFSKDEEVANCTLVQEE